MKSLFFAAIFFFVSLLLTFLFRYDGELLIVILATVLGFMLGKFIELQNDVRFLRDAFARDWEQRQSHKAHTPSQTQEDFVSGDLAAQPLDSEKEKSPDLAPVMVNVAQAEPDKTQPVKARVLGDKLSQPASSQSGVEGDQQRQHKLSDKISAYIKNYFTGGNLFVRIGIIILFFGVSFLLKYVSDRGLFPIEYRLMSVVVGSIFLLLLGWNLRHKKRTYALLLQGAGIGVLYLDIYAAFSLYHLLAPLPAFALLFVVSMLSAALAVLQDSKSLAVLGFSGGFLAPILASSGSSNHVALFSYYAVLNVALVAIAWFKAWRALNLLGFAFTFVIGAVWGVFSYSSDKFATTEPFLILFFLFYVLIAVFFALRQPARQDEQGEKQADKQPNMIWSLTGYVDGTLVFGVPLAASALQYSLVKNFEYGVSISAFATGAFYLALAWFLWKRSGNNLRLITEAFLALGVIFSSMAIPFALSPTQTAAAWAVEGAGLLWLGSRQNRWSVRAFGLLLQLGAAFFVINGRVFSQETPFINGAFISAVMMAAAGILSARLLGKPFSGRKPWEEALSPFLLVWGLLWLFGGFVVQISRHYGDQWLATSVLVLAAFCSVGFTIAAQRFKPEWRHAWYAASALLGVMLMMALLQYALPESRALVFHHPAQFYGWLAWPLAFGAFFFFLKRLERQRRMSGLQPWFHTLSMLLLVVLLTLEGDYQLHAHLAAGSDWFTIWYAMPAMLVIWLIIKARFWPFSYLQDQPRSRQLFSGLALAAYLALWGFVALLLKGNPAPLPWVPLLNPLDVSILMVLLSLFYWWRTVAPALLDYQNEKSDENKLFNKRLAQLVFGSLVFLWLNFTVFRIVHHWFDTPYTPEGMYDSSLAQTAISILWAISGVLLTIYASRNKLRGLWIAGGALLILVTLKLFVIDLSELGNLARIISFMVVGALLTSIGYFAPLPDKPTQEQ